MAEVFYWIFTFVFILTLLCILGYQLILLVDLEFDYINPYDSTSRINQVILPEFIVQGIFCFNNLIAGHWFIFLISLPCLYYNVRLYIRKEHLTDVTEIYNKLNWEKKKRLFKVAHAVVLFVLSVLRGIALTGGLPAMPAADASNTFVGKFHVHATMMVAGAATPLTDYNNSLCLV